MILKSVTNTHRTIWDLPSEFWPDGIPCLGKVQHIKALAHGIQDQRSAIMEALKKASRRASISQCAGHEFYAEWLARVTPDYDRGR